MYGFVLFSVSLSLAHGSKIFALCSGNSSENTITHRRCGSMLQAGLILLSPRQIMPFRR